MRTKRLGMVSLVHVGMAQPSFSTSCFKIVLIFSKYPYAFSIGTKERQSFVVDVDVESC